MEVYGSFCTVYFLVDLKTIGCNFRIEENGTKIDFGVCLLWRSKTSENNHLIHCMVTRMTFRFTFRLKSQISAGKWMADADAHPTWKRPYLLVLYLVAKLAENPPGSPLNTDNNSGEATQRKIPKNITA